MIFIAVWKRTYFLATVIDNHQKRECTDISKAPITTIINSAMSDGHSIRREARLRSCRQPYAGE